MTCFARTRLVLLHGGVDVHACVGHFHGLGVGHCTPVPIMGGCICVCDDGVADRLSCDQRVNSVENDMEVSLVISPMRHRRGGRQSVEFIPEGIQLIRAPSAWASSTGQGAKVAVLDTGADLTHPDLAENLAGGVNLVRPSSPPLDGHGHGTHVAGTIGAVANSRGVVGVAPGAGLYAVKVMDDSGSGYLSHVILGLQWAVDQQIRVVNMSLSTKSDHPALRTAVKNAADAGVLLVAAAGNDGRPNSVNYPARYPAVVAVSALTFAGRLAGFSSSGPEVDLSAPGAHVLSTLPRGRYGQLSGTSMASPHVAGVAALYLGLYPHATPDQVRAALRASATHMPGLNQDEQGAGRVDALAMVKQAPPQATEAK